MAAARLSPAATLLRNSRLFALPPSLALPPAEASSEPVARSDTATTPFPIRAAIETPQLSLHRGDWGLKRSLPQKSTTKTGTPVIRIQRGLDTPEHTVDFESAADHVLTLQKWQHLNMPVQYPSAAGADRSTRSSHGVFNSFDDNTTNTSALNDTRQNTGVWPNVPTETSEVVQRASENARAVLRQEAELNGLSQPEINRLRTPEIKNQKRWRYDGPWLAGMTGMEFEDFLNKRVRGREAEFKDKLRAHIRAERLTSAKMRAMEEGTLVGSQAERSSQQQDASSANLQSSDVSEEDLEIYTRSLRKKPRVFGALIADFLDLPDGPRPRDTGRNLGSAWEYGRDTTAASEYRDSGPPRTHPSAGLSYIHSKKYALNDPTYGPQKAAPPVVGRILKLARRGTTNATVGVAGFVTPPVPRGMTNFQQTQTSEFKPTSGGQKILVVPEKATVNSQGKLELQARTSAVSGYAIEDDAPVRVEESKMPQQSQGHGRFGTQTPQLDRNYRRKPVERKTATSGRSEGADVIKFLDQLQEGYRKDKA